jgi:hypothetical protein
VVVEALAVRDPDRVGSLQLLKKEVGERTFADAGLAGNEQALTVAFHDRCDMIVATAALGNNDPALQHEAVLDLLNSDLVLRWVETTLGL